MSKIDSSASKKTLFLDIGNSSIKVAFKEGGGWERIGDNFKSVTYLISWIQKHSESIEKLIVASVRKDHFKLLHTQIQDIVIEQIKTDNIPSSKLNYETPETLGIDRYLVCLGAYTEMNGTVVVVDAGSACTIDLIDKFGVYQGGIIMPGISSIMEIFKNTAPELPEIIKEIPTEWPGKSTSKSLQWGQIGLFVDGIESALKRYKNLYGNFDLYITGGDADLVADLIAEHSQQDTFLIFKGMEALINE
jgi:type III pantothenate kinase